MAGAANPAVHVRDSKFTTSRPGVSSAMTLKRTSSPSVGNATVKSFRKVGSLGKLETTRF
jgi:hypothetical protein